MNELFNRLSYALRTLSLKLIIISIAAPLTQGQIGETAPVRYKRKGGYWWSKANVDDDEMDDDLIG